MDKQLLKAYIRTIVEEEVKKLLPELLGEAVAQIKNVNKLDESVKTDNKPKIDKSRLAQLMGIDYDRGNATIRATGVAPSVVVAKDAAGNSVQIPADSVPSEVISAINKDYSALMKKMKLT